MSNPPKTHLPAQEGFVANAPTHDPPSNLTITHRHVEVKWHLMIYATASLVFAIGYTASLFWG